MSSMRIIHLNRNLLLILSLIVFAGCESEKKPPIAPVQPVINYGDINLNGLSYEIADAVLYSNYFVYGRAVFLKDSTMQIAASDINMDGRELTIADLVYLTRIIYGDAAAIPKVDLLPVRYARRTYGYISVIDNVKIGAALVILSGQETPRLLADEMDMIYNYDGFETRVLVWSYHGEYFTDDFLEVSSQIISIEMATFEGQPVSLSQLTLYDEIFISQNVPNPFNSTTSIYFGLPRSMEADVIITDELGRAVFKLSKIFRAGGTSIVWDGTDYTGQLLPNGIYYCSLIVLENSKTIEMILQR